MNGQGIPCRRNSSYSFIPILSKLHWCFGHGLKTCMWFGYQPQINFIIYIKPQLNVYHFSSIFPLQCYQYHQGLYICSAFECKCSYSFIQYFMKLLYVLMSWPEDMDMLWIKFLSFDSVFCSSNLSCSMIVYIDKKWRGT